MTMDYPYQIYDRYGTPVLQAKEECRYHKEIERGLLEHGYTIKLNGKKITMTDIRKEIKNGSQRKRAGSSY